MYLTHKHTRNERVAKKKGAMAFVVWLGFSQEDTMEGFLWIFPLEVWDQTIRVRVRLGGTCHGNVNP